MSPYLLFFFLALGQVGRFSFFNQQININLFDLYIVFALTIWGVQYKFTPLVKSFRRFKPLYLFLFWIVLTYLVSIFRFTTVQNLVALLYLLRIFIYITFFIYCSYVLKRVVALRNRYQKAISLFIVATGMFSTLQYALYPNLRNLSYLGWDPHQYRVFGSFLDTSAASAIFGLILLYLLFYKKMYSKKFHVFFIGTYLILGLLTYSRAFYLSAIGTISIFLLIKKQLKLIIPIILFFLLTLFILPKQFGEGTNLLRIFSVESRFKDQKEAVLISVRNPLFGIGYNHIGSLKNKEKKLNELVSHTSASFHSSFLIILATSGIIGLSLFILLLFSFATISFTSRFYVIFLSLFSFFDNILLYPVVMVLLLSLLSLEEGKQEAVTSHI